MQRDGIRAGYAGLERRIRQLVADQLGLGADELASHVSLTDDLAADSLDLVELTLTLEEHLDVAISEYALQQVRTYGDLVDTILSTLRRGRAAGLHARPPLVRARIFGPEGGPDAGTDGRVEPRLIQTAELTPYATQTIGEEARRAGRGARLELIVPRAATDVELAWVATQFAWLEERGLTVSVHRDAQPSLAPKPTAVAH